MYSIIIRLVRLDIVEWAIRTLLGKQCYGTNTIIYISVL
jgi:hypothetical protein